MEKFISTKGFKRDVFDVVDIVPLGYKIWNIGNNIEDGYLPFVRVGGYDGCQVDPESMRVMKVKDAQIILNAIGFGPSTVKEMETYIETHKNSDKEFIKNNINRLEKALKVMYTLNGINDLR